MQLQQAALGSPLAYANPVYQGSFADPFVLKHGGVWHAYGTGPCGPEGVWGEFPTLRSEDFVYWEPGQPALMRPSGFEGGSFWAPEVACSDGLFFLYYSVGQGDKAHQIRVSVSDSPHGPFEDRGRLTPESCPFAIDACPYQHPDGSCWLFYASDLVEGERPGTVLFVDRLISMTELAGEPSLVARATKDWQRFEKDRAIYGKNLDWHTLEGPAVHFRDGRVWCLYSGGNWQNETYGVDFVVADHPLGPWEDTATDHARTLKTLPGKALGPGHNSVCQGPDGVTDYIVYHAWNLERTHRQMRVDPLAWTEDGPRCLGPTTDPQFLSPEIR